MWGKTLAGLHRRVEGVVEGLQELGLGEGLGQEGAVTEELKLLDLGRLKTTAGDDDAGGGDDAAEGADEIQPVHLRHVEIGNDGVEGVLVLDGVDDGLGAVGGGEDAVVQGGEDGGDGVAHGGLVIDDEDELALAGVVAAAGGGGRGIEIDEEVAAEGGLGEVDGEGGALAGGGLDADEAAMAADDTEGGGEAEAGAAVGPFGAEEGLEDAVEQLGLDAEAGVADLADDVAAGGGLGLGADEGGVELDVFGGDFEAAAGRHGVAGVDAEVEDDLVELGGVSEDEIEPGGVLEVELDVLREGAVDDEGDLIEEITEADGLALALDAT